MLWGQAARPLSPEQLKGIEEHKYSCRGSSVCEEHLQKFWSWSLILAAVCVFVYQTLDALDGKQARKTDTSSPLGELFDHGCDAISTGL
ncbi:unnamed protein product [Dibothriocephalus latus]|uniref:Uncharacterized protein n=1 Tax=Dibothriocephalus latus TaxID=60516 RepID=A0A3P7LIW5_DIBLA|nr:unnamed protein product [Dibothriocephalus latus]